MSTPRKPDSRDRQVVAVPRSWLIALPLVMILPWLVAAGVYYRLAPRAEEAGAGNEQPATRGTRIGPWGRLTVTPIVVSPPLEYVAADWNREEAPDQWLFPDTSPDLLRSFLASSGFTPDQVATLTSAARPEPRIRGFVVYPDREIVRSMSAEVRARVYNQLARTSLNFDQAQSFRFFGADPDEWLRGSLISDETREFVESLIYRDGEFLHFSDAELARAEIKDPAELQRLAKTLLRQSTMLVRLSIDRAGEVAALSQYWGRGGRSTDIRPLLESIAGAGDDRSIDIVHLLPAFARNRLYRYPQLTAADLDRPLLVNCLWSSLNFFRGQPDDRFLDLNTALATLRQDYYIVESEYQLGDVVGFVDAEGDLFHAAVYVADDLLFTKNGTSPVAPWTLMPIDRVKGYYRFHAENPRLIFHRRKDL
ncbi:MAG TPA: hypothetical protein VM364_12800 [Vicinamibacterales bacterium]|nr:hypothetical protein [Vicinamibacterales bacterium]